MIADLRKMTWLDDLFVYGGANVYRPGQLKEEIDNSSEWAARFRSNLDCVSAERRLTAVDHVDRTEVSFDADAGLFNFLASLHRILRTHGPAHLQFCSIADLRTQAWHG